MKGALRTLLGVVVGMVVAFVLVIAVEAFSSVVYPVPPELKDNIPEHVRRYPQWILAVVVVDWSATIAAATWVASRLGNRVAGLIVALLLACALIFNLSMLPYAPWFKVAMLIALPVACLIGIKYGNRTLSPAGVEP